MLLKIYFRNLITTEAKTIKSDSPKKWQFMLQQFYIKLLKNKYESWSLLFSFQQYKGLNSVGIKVGKFRFIFNLTTHLKLKRETEK